MYQLLAWLTYNCRCSLHSWRWGWRHLAGRAGRQPALGSTTALAPVVEALVQRGPMGQPAGMPLPGAKGGSFARPCFVTLTGSLLRQLMRMGALAQGR